MDRTRGRFSLPIAIDNDESLLPFARGTRNPFRPEKRFQNSKNKPLLFFFVFLLFLLALLNILISRNKLCLLSFFAFPFFFKLIITFEVVNFEKINVIFLFFLVSFLLFFLTNYIMKFLNDGNKTRSSVLISFLIITSREILG